MGDTTSSTPSPTVVRSNKPVSEALLNDKVRQKTLALPRSTGKDWWSYLLITAPRVLVAAFNLAETTALMVDF